MSRHLAPLSFGLVLLAPSVALGHEPFEIATDVQIHPDRMAMVVMIADVTAAQICAPTLGGASLDRAHFTAIEPSLARCARELFAVESAGQPLVPSRVTVALTEDDDLEARLEYPRPASGVLRLDARFLSRLPDPTYGAVLTANDESRFLGQELLRANASLFSVDLTPAAAAPGSAGARPSPDSGEPPEPSAPPPGRTAAFGSYLRLGVEHILTGYDHLLFLIGLLAVTQRLRSVFSIVTSFTVAHSLTLAAAALDLVHLPSSVIEPLIAASIVYVGIENLRSQAPRQRWLLAFGFGLIHGFGFAGVLRELGLGQNGAPIVLPLLGFNLGVELGQAAVATLVVPLLWQFRRNTTLARRSTQWLSLGVATLGAVWLVERLAAL